MPATNQIDHLFRSSYGRITGLLVARYGVDQLDTVENAVMEAYYRALKSWPYAGTPDNQQAWLYRAAHNALIDEFRKRSRYADHELEVMASSFDPRDLDEDEIKDPELKMLFLICHPALRKEDQLAFMLKTLSGLGDKEISRALMVKQTTIKKRLQRARQNLRDKKVIFDWPQDNEVGDRLQMVHTALYLLFNEGFYSTHEEHWVRKDLCVEAMRLCKYLVDHPIANRNTSALMSLMCYHISRYESRLDADGNIILLSDQDRNKWDRYFIKLGHFYLKKSATDTLEKSKYQLEAFISAQHCMASSIATTNWGLLKRMYYALYNSEPQDLILLNIVVVHLHLDEVDTAKEVFDNLKVDQFESHKTIYYMVGVELYSRLKDKFQIELLLEKAIQSSDSEKESIFLKDKLKDVKGNEADGV